MTNPHAQNNELIENYYPRKFQMQSCNPSWDIFSLVLKHYILKNDVFKIVGGVRKATDKRKTKKNNFRCHGNQPHFVHLLYVNGSFALKF